MAKRSDPKGIRMQSIHRMQNMLRGGGDVPLKRFLATCSYTMGLTRRTSMSYLQDLVALDLVEVNEDTDVVREVVKA